MKKAACCLMICMFCFAICFSVSAEEIYISGEFGYLLSSEGDAYLQAYSGIDRHVVVPQELDGYTVTMILNTAFRGNTEIEQIDLPDSLKALEAHCFEGCTALAYMDIPDGVKIVSDYAFSGCISLVSVDLPDKLDMILAHAFNGCVSLSSVEIPPSCTLIQSYAFEYCDNLNEVVIPEAVKILGLEAFYGSPTRVYCKRNSAAALSMSSSVTDVSGGFIDPEWPDMRLYYWYNGADGTKHLTLQKYLGGDPHVTIPGEIKKIGREAFYRNKTLKSVTLLDGLTEIFLLAFSDCDELTSVYIPSSVKRIGSGAFGDCASLKDVEIADGVEVLSSPFEHCPSLRSVILPDSVKEIIGEAFYECKSLRYVRLSPSMKEIPNFCFQKCSQLQYVEIPDGIEHIGVSAFADCKALRSVDLPAGLKTIGSEAFSGCESLEKLVIPTGITSLTVPISKDAAKLNTLVLPRELTEIEKDVFDSAVRNVYCYKNSNAHTWAKQNGKKIFLLDEMDVSQVQISGRNMSDPRQFVFEVGTTCSWRSGISLSPLPYGVQVTLACESSDPGVARIEGDTVVFLNEGNAVLTIRIEEYPEKMVEWPIEVYHPVESYKVPDPHVFVKYAPSMTIEIENIEPENANPYFILSRLDEWEICDDELTVQMDRHGSYALYLSAFSGEEHLIILVAYEKVESISAQMPEEALAYGGRVRPVVAVQLDDMSFENEKELYTLVSSDERVIQVVDGDEIYAAGLGKATVTAIALEGEKTASFDVVVCTSKVLHLPSDLVRIEDEAFAGTDCEAIVVADDCVFIGEHAFADCAHMMYADIPAGVERIAENAFDGCPKTMVIIAPEGSAAADYAEAHGYGYMKAH